MRTVKNISRQIFVDDFDLENFYLEADGATQIEFSDKEFLSFYADTKNMSVTMKNGEMEKYGDSYQFVDISKLNKINSLIGEKVTDISQQKNGYKLKFSNGSILRILYRSTEEYLDSIYLMLS